MGIALLRGFEGASKLPQIAAIICAVVVLVWMGLFWMMRGFFERQTRERVEVVRRLHLQEDGQLEWSESGETLKRVEDPIWRLARAPHAQDDAQRAAPVYLIAAGSQETFVLETRARWEEAKELACEQVEPDETLPAHVASPLLERARSR